MAFRIARLFDSPFPHHSLSGVGGLWFLQIGGTPCLNGGCPIRHRRSSLVSALVYGLQHQRRTGETSSLAAQSPKRVSASFGQICMRSHHDGTLHDPTISRLIHIKTPHNIPKGRLSPPFWLAHSLLHCFFLSILD